MKVKSRGGHFMTAVAVFTIKNFFCSLARSNRKQNFTDIAVYGAGAGKKLFILYG